MATTKESEVKIAEGTYIPGDEYDTYIPIQYSKSNVLIGSKYKSTLFENKLLAISLANIPYNAEETDSGTLVTTLKAAEIRKMLHANSGSFYSQLNSAAQSMTAKSIGFNDPENQKFEYIAVVIRAAYENGYFTLEYNPHIKNYLTDIKSNFTKLNLPIMLKFESVYTFRLYELLKSKAYIPKNQQSKFGNRPVRKFNIRIKVSELKLTLGIVNAELDSVKKILNNSKTPDFDKAVEVAQERMYSDMGDFKRRVIETALDEINRVSDMNVQYEPIRTKSGKNVEFIFKVEFKDNNQNNTIVLSSEEKDEIIDKISDLIDHPLKIKDIRAIAEAAEYDYDLIKRTYEGVEASSGNISNFTGFMISAIKGEYYEDVGKKPKSSAAKNKKPGDNPFNQFKQNSYDYDQLELELAARYEEDDENIIDVELKEA